MAMTSRLHPAPFAAASSGQALLCLVVSSLLHHAALHPLEEMILEITEGISQFSPKGLRIKCVHCFLFIRSLSITSVWQLSAKEEKGEWREDMLR